MVFQIFYAKALLLWRTPISPHFSRLCSSGRVEKSWQPLLFSCHTGWKHGTQETCNTVLGGGLRHVPKKCNTVLGRAGLYWMSHVYVLIIFLERFNEDPGKTSWGMAGQLMGSMGSEHQPMHANQCTRMAN